MLDIDYSESSPTTVRRIGPNQEMIMTTAELRTASQRQADSLRLASLTIAELILMQKLISMHL